MKYLMITYMLVVLLCLIKNRMDRYFIAILAGYI